MNGLSLFTGSGIGELVLKEIIPGYRTVGYVEWDKFCQRLIQRRIQDGCLDDAPIWDDVRTFDGRPWAGRVDFISAGFPCQPFSVAGKRRADADERNMWPDTIRIISEVRPRYALLENVRGLAVSEYAGAVIGDLTACGYDAEWDVVPAGFVGAAHLRERWWILAYPIGYGRERGNKQTTSKRGQREQLPSSLCGFQVRAPRIPAPRICRRTNDVANLVDRIRCCGNGWCPATVARILTVTED